MSGSTHSSSYSLGLTASYLLVLLFGFGPNLIEARCGYPELPYKSQLSPPGHFENLGFFEEGQRVKVICENGLVGHHHNVTTLNATATTTASSQEQQESNNFMQIDGSAWIECRNSHWNASELRCLEKLELDSRNVQVKWRQLETVRNVEPLVDHDALSCLDLDLDKANLEEDGSVLLSLRLETQTAHIPRVVLMLKNVLDQGKGHNNAHHTNVTLLEDLTSEEANLAAASNDTEQDGGDVELEESKRFLDFVYHHEFVNHSAAGTPVRMMLMEDDESDHSHKVIRTERHEVRVSVALGGAEEQKRRPCAFNEDAAIAVGQNRDTTTTTELLIFDCHLMESGDKASLVWVRLDITKLNDPTTTTTTTTTTNAVASNGTMSTNIEAPLPVAPTTASSRSMLSLCGLEAFALADTDCGRPYVPVYGLVSKTANASVALYSCQSGYRAINLTTEHLESRFGELSPPLPLSAAARLAARVPLQRTCDRAASQWRPATEDIFCVPLAMCRNPPPLPNPQKFYFEYSKLDNLKRAIAGVSTATLRCQMLTDYVMPYTIYGCDKSGEWHRLGKANESEPICRTSLTRTGGGRRRGQYYHHHYYHYYDQPPTNKTSIIIFGRPINDNKNLIYVGAAGLVVLFGGSFIILFHVRRMAKKISRQIRERSYMAAEKGISDQFLPVSGTVESGLPPYYNNGDNFYDSNTMFSNDLPPPATPISMPTSGGLGEKGDHKDRNNLSSGFDSIKF